jgi:replicative DNA helicase
MSSEPVFECLPGGKRDLKASAGLFSRTQPHSLEAEEYLLSCCFVDGKETLARCEAAGLRPAAFYAAANQKIFAALLDMDARGVPLAIDVLAEELKAGGQLADVGGVTYLMQITKKIPTTAQAAYFVERVKVLWERRVAISVSGAFCEQMFDEGTSAAALREQADALGKRLITLGRSKVTKPLTDIIEDVKEAATAASEGRMDKSRWIYFGLPTFDATLRPFASSREDLMTVTMGASTYGKSVVSRQISDSVLRQGKRALCFPLENDAWGYIEKLVSARMGIDLLTLEGLPRDLLAKFHAGCEEIATEVKDRRLFIVDRKGEPFHHVEDLVEYYEQFVQLHGPPDAVFVDSAQRYLPRRRTTSEQEQQTAVADAIQCASHGSGRPWFVDVQINETARVEMETAKRDGDGKLIHRLPRQGDLRMSQRWFHNADRVLALYKPPVDSWGNENLRSMRPEQWIVQLKRKSGPEGLFVKTWFEKKYSRFIEFTASEFSASESAASRPPSKMDKKDWRAGKGGGF